MTRKVKGLSFYQKPARAGRSLLREIFLWVTGVVLAVFLAVAAGYGFGLSTNVVGDSMEPTLSNGQQILIDRVSYLLSSPKAGDVVVFKPKGNQNAHYYVKRVVAVPGDTVLISDGVLYVNGEESDLISAEITDAGIAVEEFTLGSDEYFCIGDNPADSEDSRSANVGTVSSKMILGKVWFHLSSETGGPGFVR